jgi:cyanophycin synthetase
MKILDVKVMRGPNFWSNFRKKLIVLKLDIGTLETQPTNEIPGFAERLEALLPSMFEHQCSEGKPGGFFSRVQDGTWMGHVVEHIALEIQTLAGMECGYGRTRSTNVTGVYHVVFSYEYEKAGLYAGEAAVRIAEALISGETYDLQADIEAMQYIRRKTAFGPSTGAIVAEVVKRNIPFRRVGNDSLVTFGYGNKQKKIRASITGNTSGLGVELAGDKDETKTILSQSNIPVPAGKLIVDAADLEAALADIRYPLVIKPADGNHGRGITTNITTPEAAKIAFELAKTISRYIIVEEFVEGYDYRFLVVDFKLVAVARRTPAMVIGDGLSTVAELIEQTNSQPERGEGHENTMTRIVVDEVTHTILAKNNKSLETILTMGEILFLKDTANLSSGGTSRDVTDLVHPFTKFVAERTARLLNLDVCGIDVVAKDINIPLTRDAGAIVEVNACPGLRMHLNPAKGVARNVAEPIVDMLFPKNETGRIPLIAVTGTNGKTTTTRLISHIAKQAGHQVGYTTSDGVYIQDHLVQEGDCTGPVSAQMVLFDPSIDFAVLECARGGILRSGLGFDNCNISVVTNVTEDHLGLKDIHTLKDLAQVKSVVARSTFSNGYTVLNADDDLVYDMRHDVDCKVALFSMHEGNERIQQHREKGGMTAVIENGYLTVYKGKWKIRVDRVSNIPLSLNGKAECMIKNILAATLTAVIQGFSMEDIRQGLTTFIPSAAQTPGRMNIFNFNHLDLMIDYAHNPDGLTQLKKFMDHTEASVKIGVLSATGDRRDEDIRNIGRLAAEMFDELIIKHDHDMRGREKEEVTRLLLEGAYSVKELPVKIISDELEAIREAYNNAPKDAFITVLADHVPETIAFVTQLHTEQQPATNTDYETVFAGNQEI